MDNWLATTNTRRLSNSRLLDQSTDPRRCRVLAAGATAGVIACYFFPCYAFLKLRPEQVGSCVCSSALKKSEICI